MNVQAKGKSVFFLLRQGVATIQGCMFQSATIPAAMITYAGSLSRESVVDIHGDIVTVKDPINSASIKMAEIHIKSIYCVSKSAELPFQLTDASRSESELAEKNEDGTPKYVSVLQDTRLDYRWIDLRTPANQAIMRVKSMVSTLFREFLLKHDFVEMHTPKLLSGASEGGANVFKLKYFDRDACLAQSPQFYKQMICSASGFERCFEIGPVFRAENSNTARHLCEFTGMDFEMTIKEHYFEALDVFGGLFNYIFDGINERCKTELAAIQSQYPFEPIQYLKDPLRLTFQEGLALLREAGYTVGEYDDLSTETEKALGAIVKEKFGTDFYMLDKYPLAVRPFYTMPDPENPQLSNSYDMFIRGQEIISGAQRIHDVDLLVERANFFKIPLDSIKGYLDSFRYVYLNSTIVPYLPPSLTLSTLVIDTELNLMLVEESASREWSFCSLDLTTSARLHSSLAIPRDYHLK
jgi:nondiscriminating aspartyl-tRNA synthetase